MTKTTNATTSSRWIKLPAICRVNPRSHKIKHTAMMVQSIILSCRFTELAFRLLSVHLPTARLEPTLSGHPSISISGFALTVIIIVQINAGIVCPDNHSSHVFLEHPAE